MPTVHLDDRSVVLVAGPDAEHFLQNLVTTDLDGLPAGEARPGALLSPQGKILFDFLISRTPPSGFRLDCRADMADDFLRRLMLYKLRAKVELSRQEQEVVLARWDGDSGSSDADSSSGWFADTRFPAALRMQRGYAGAPVADAVPAAWHGLRIAHGIAESGTDYQPGDAFPHDVLLDQSGGIGFHKGCYVGQEVVSRMQHRGTARRRVMLVEAGTALPAGGTAIVADGRPVGTLGDSDGRRGLAIARIDRVKEALDAGHPFLAGDVPVTLSIPAWATYTLPAGNTGGS